MVIRDAFVTTLNIRVNANASPIHIQILEQNKWGTPVEKAGKNDSNQHMAALTIAEYS